jgi:hypothetical protein
MVLVEVVRASFEIQVIVRFDLEKLYSEFFAGTVFMSS